MHMRWLVFFLIILNALVFVWFNYQQKYSYSPSDDELTQPFDFSAVKQLELLAELSDEERYQRDLRRVASTTEEAEPLEQVPVDEKPGGDTVTLMQTCMIIGSFPEVISARQVRIALEENAVPSKIVQIAKKLPPVSWVYIPPQASRKDALMVLKSLQDKKIDSFLMNEPGEYQYAISLGFYGNADSARSIQRERQAQGYDAQLTMRVRERKAYWVGVENPQLLAEEKTQKVIENIVNQNKSIKKQEISCTELALVSAIN